MLSPPDAGSCMHIPPYRPAAWVPQEAYLRHHGTVGPDGASAGDDEDQDHDEDGDDDGEDDESEDADEGEDFGGLDDALGAVLTDGMRSYQVRCQGPSAACTRDTAAWHRRPAACRAWGRRDAGTSAAAEA